MGTVEELAVDILRACQQNEHAKLKILLHQVCPFKDFITHSVIVLGLCRIFVFPFKGIHTWMENVSCVLIIQGHEMSCSDSS